MNLRDYQKEIAAKAAELIEKYKIAYLAMECRTGKTLTAFESVRLLRKNSVLFITTKKAIKSIEKDYSEFNNLMYSYFYITVVNYESLHKIDSSEKYDIIIIDEAHKIGQFPKPALRTKRLKEICRNKPIIYLSGTPTPESYSQIYHQFWVSSFSPFFNAIGVNNFYKWAKGYVNIKQKKINGTIMNDYRDANEANIKEKINHLFLSFTQKQAGFELSEVQEIKHIVKMQPETLQIIDEILKNRICTFADSAIICDTPASLQQKIHQLASGSVIAEKEGKRIYKIIDKSKAEYIKKTFASKKIAIYYHYKAEFDILKEFFPNFTHEPQEFNQSSDKVFLAQFVAGREGVALPTTDDIIFYNIAFSAVSYFQARERHIFKNRTAQARLHWIFSEGGIEEKIYRVVCKKKNYTINYFRRDFL